jgi:4-amino-4-deoxy-L-arabinose transferase-like glycosyltransferase
MKSYRRLKRLFFLSKVDDKYKQIRQKSRAGKTKIYLSMVVFLLCPLTLWGTTQNFNLTMMALTTFCIAYLGKGLRRPKPGVGENWPN